MSSEPESTAGERRRDRACRDVRFVHRAYVGLIERLGGAGWDRARAGPWSPAETLLHEALVAEHALQGLRLASLRGADMRRPEEDLRVAARRHFSLLTWRLPESAGAVLGTEPDGLVLAAEDLRRRHTAWTADWIQQLRDWPPTLLGNIHHACQGLGWLDPVEWSRLLRIRARRSDLALTTGKPRA